MRDASQPCKLGLALASPSRRPADAMIPASCLRVVRIDPPFPIMHGSRPPEPETYANAVHELWSGDNGRLTCDASSPRPRAEPACMLPGSRLPTNDDTPSRASKLVLLYNSRVVHRDGSRTLTCMLLVHHCASLLAAV